MTIFQDATAAHEIKTAGLHVCADAQEVCASSPFAIDVEPAPRTECHHRTRGSASRCGDLSRWAVARFPGLYCTEHAAARVRLLEREL